MRLDTIGLGDTEIDQELFFSVFPVVSLVASARLANVGKTCAGQSGCKHPRFRYLENILKTIMLCFLMSAIMNP